MQKLDRTKILEGMRDRIPVRLKSFAMLDATEETMKELLQLMLKYYKRDYLMEAVYTSIKELAINAVKANMKRVVFKEHNLDIHNPDHYARGQELFKRRLRDGRMEEYAAASKRMGYHVYIDFIPEEDCLTAEVRNNSIIARDENKRLREKLAKSMTYEDIAQFYMDFADDTEGAGLGMTMITVMLKQNEIDPHCFTIFHDDDYTIARLEVPMSDHYIPRRQRYAD